MSHVSVPKPFASGDAEEWFKRYEICCTANGWDDQMKARKLPTVLEGEALAVWLELQETQQENYAAAKKEISKALMPMEFVSLDQFHKRKLQPGEPLSVFVHEIKKLLRQAIPELEETTRNQLLLHQFMAGLPDSVSRQLRASGTITKLDEAVSRARLLMTVDESSCNVATVAKDDCTEMKALREQVDLLTEQVSTLSLSIGRGRTNSQPNRQSRRCFTCNRMGHMQRECPFNSQQGIRCFVCGQLGHVAKNCRQQGNNRGASAMGNRHPYTY